MKRSSRAPMERTEANLRFIMERAKVCQSLRSEDQELLVNDIYDFFSEEFEEAMNYTGRLPSFRDCGGKAERMKLLKDEAFLIIWQQAVLGEDFADFEQAIERFKKSIRKKLLEYTQVAQKESIRIDVAKDKRTNENEKCTIMSGKKDITSDITKDNTGMDMTDDTEVMDNKSGRFMRF